MHISSLEVLQKLWLLMFAFWVLTAIGQKQAIFTESAGQSMKHRFGAVAGFLLLFAHWLSIGVLGWQVIPARAWLSWLALVIGVAGFALAFWARILLGGEWSSNVSLKTEHRLIASGPYSLVRHPIYTGLLMAMLGTAIAGYEVRMYLGVLVAFCSWWYKSRLEERLLLHAMGQRYSEYQRHTYALIPGLL